MGKKNDPKMKAYAAWMKDHNITRKTGMCPWGCGTKITNGGSHLISHLRRCQGPRRKV